MDREAMLDRTREFAIRIIRLVAALPRDRVGDVLGRQILKSGTSVGANYREALRASSRRQFITTLEIVQREADETIYWLDLLSASGTVQAARLEAIQCECHELLAIVTATIRTAKRTRSADSTLPNQKSEIKNQK